MQLPSDALRYVILIWICIFVFYVAFSLSSAQGTQEIPPDEAREGTMQLTCGVSVEEYISISSENSSFCPEGHEIAAWDGKYIPGFAGRLRGMLVPGIIWAVVLVILILTIRVRKQ
jgi:hypothetical protein